MLFWIIVGRSLFRSLVLLLGVHRLSEFLLVKTLLIRVVVGKAFQGPFSTVSPRLVCVIFFEAMVR